MIARIPYILTFYAASPAANTTTAMLLLGDVPAVLIASGYDFYPEIAALASDTDLTAGTASLQVTADGVALTGGPEPVLSDTVQELTSAIDASPKVAAGALFGAQLVTSATYAPTTSNLVAVVSGYLIPA